jgi:hypothetical protein
MKEKDWKMTCGNSIMHLDFQVVAQWTRFAANDNAPPTFADQNDMVREVFTMYPLIKAMVDAILAMDKCKKFLADRPKCPM